MANSRLTHCIAVQQEEAVCVPSILYCQVKRMCSIQVCLFLHDKQQQKDIIILLYYLHKSEHESVKSFRC